MIDSFMFDFQRSVLELLSPTVIGIYALVFLTIVISASAIIIWHWKQHSITPSQEHSSITWYVWPTMVLLVLNFVFLLIVALR